jgi:hypothetical protein
MALIKLDSPRFLASASARVCYDFYADCSGRNLSDADRYHLENFDFGSLINNAPRLEL